MANFTGTGGNDIWTGGLDADYALGGAGDDTLSGSDGDDIVAGEAGADTLNGGDGDDRIYSDVESPPFNPPYYDYPFTAPVLDTGTASDTITGGAGSDTIFAGYGDNVDGGTDGSYGDYLYISFQGATVGVNADFTLGAITIGGGTIQNIENLSWIEGSNYGDYIVAETTASNGYSNFTVVFGMGGNDHLVAGYYTGRMEGGDGNDIVDGRNSQYLQGVYGNAGDDTLYTNTNTFAVAHGGDGNDTIYSHGETYGGAGNDTIVLQTSYYTGLVYGEDGDDVITASDSNTHVMSGGAGADQLNGGSGEDQIYSHDYGDGFGPDDALDVDTLSGGAGGDYLWAGYGDHVDGGTGTDTLLYSFAGLSTGVTFDTAEIISGQPNVLGGGTIQNIENLLTIWGTSSADRFTLATQNVWLTLHAGGGNDTITIGGSTAEVYGGDGNDRIFSGAAADNIIGGAGRDIVDYRFYASGVVVDLQAGTGAGGDTISEVESVLGSNFDDTLSGDGLNNTLTGNGGNDTIYGLAGNDALTGGAGIDVLYGGLGNDLYYVSDGGDIVIEASGAGYDTMKSSISCFLVDNVERLVLGGTSAIDGSGNGLANNLTGNSAANTLLGYAGDDFLVGGGGLDQLDGGEGSDTYYVGSFAEYVDAHITDTGPNGWDVVRFAGTTAGTLVMQASDTGIEEIDIATSAGSVANFAGTAAINVDASALGSGVIIRGNNGANILTGTAVNDNLYGNLGNDTLNGGQGHDVLDGGRGADVMNGGAGSDVYYVDSAGDSVVEAPGVGNDSVFSTIGYTLGEEVENLVLLGSNNLSGTGNLRNNSLTGNSAANTLDGLGGFDNLNGGAGNDILNGGGDNDWLVGGAGRDRLTGESGADIFVFDEGDFAGLTISDCDRIMDFSQVQGDQIRLEDIDANTLIDGDQGFNFLGSDAFSGAAGELRTFQTGGNTYVQGDINGDGVGDFMIRLEGLHALQASDIVM